MLPVIVESSSVATEIHTPKNNTIAIEETQKEMIPKTECPCLSISNFRFILDLNTLDQLDGSRARKYIFNK